MFATNHLATAQPPSPFTAMSRLTDSLRNAAKNVTAQQDALDRVLTENEATLATAELQSRRMDVELDKAAAEMQALFDGVDEIMSNPLYQD